jgi:FkbM family methyltransferase
MTNRSGPYAAGKAKRALRMIRAHPDLLVAKLSARRRSRSEPPSGEVDGFVGSVRFRFNMDLDPRVVEMYQRTHSLEVVHALGHLLMPGDTFVDVGANIGYLSAVAADRVGPSGRVIAFEPVPAYASRLRRLVTDNPTLQITVVQQAVGDVDGHATIDVSAIGNLGWNTMVPGFMPEDHRGERLEVDVVRLDDALDALDATNASVIKIDVEGFEVAVLRGIEGNWERGERPAIICELSPNAFALAGTSVDELADVVGRWGYEAVELLDLRTTVDLSAPTLSHGDVLLRQSRSNG